MKLSMLKKKTSSERGASTVEFAFIASLLFLVLFGIIEFGLTFFQEHFVSNAAREGLRIGVIAHNYNCFAGNPAEGCNNDTDRHSAVELRVRDYLQAIYSPGDILNVEIESPESSNDDATRKPLIISVTARNLMPSIIAGFVPGYSPPEAITFTAIGDYENPEEP